MEWIPIKKKEILNFFEKVDVNKKDTQNLIYFEEKALRTVTAYIDSQIHMFSFF